MTKIVATGRGGVGKTSVTALLCRYFKEKSPPVLVIDADPDQNLAEMVGLDSKKIKTVSDVLFDIKVGNIEEKLKSSLLAEKIDYLINQNVLYESNNFDFLSLGVKWTEGCYCQPNNILKGIVERLGKNYKLVLIDTPAGLEHLNRRIMSSVDEIFAIIDPSKKAFDNVKRTYKIISEIGIKFDKFYIIGNYRFPDSLLGSVEEQTGFKCLGKLDFDSEVEKFNLEGKSSFELKEDSSLFKSVKQIMKKAGY